MGHFCLHLHILPRQFRSRLVILVFLSSSLSLTPFPHPTFLPFASAFYCKTGIRLSVSYYSLLRSHFSVFLILTCLMPIFLRNNPFISLPNSHLFLFIPIFLLISILLFSSLSLFRLLFFIVHPHPHRWPNPLQQQQPFAIVSGPVPPASRRLHLRTDVSFSASNVGGRSEKMYKFCLAKRNYY